MLLKETNHIHCPKCSTIFDINVKKIINSENNKDIDKSTHVSLIPTINYSNNQTLFKSNSEKYTSQGFLNVVRFDIKIDDTIKANKRINRIWDQYNYYD